MSTRMFINGRVIQYTKDPVLSSEELPHPVISRAVPEAVSKFNDIFYAEMDNIPNNWIDQSAICHLLGCSEADLVELIRQGLIDCGVHRITRVRYYLVKKYEEVLDHFRTIKEKENAKERNKQKAVHGGKNDTRGTAPKASNSSSRKVQWVRR